MLALTCGALFVAVAACGKGEPGKKKGQGDRPPPLVSVAKIVARDVDVLVRAPVDLRPLAQADVGSKTLGYLDAVLVDRGDLVKRRQVLALVRPSDLPDQLSAARSALAQTQSSAALARSNHERARQLAPAGAVSQQELQSTNAALASAEAAEASAKAQIAGLAVRVGETRITSPLDGVIIQRRLDPGALVGPSVGTPIVTVARLDVLRVFIAVNEHDAGRVALGKEARVQVDSLPGRTFTGKVARLAPMFDPLTRTLDAEVHLDNVDGLLWPGMYGRGAIVLETHSQVPVVPAVALQLTDNKMFVFVVDGGSRGEPDGAAGRGPARKGAGAPAGGPTAKVERRAIETGFDGEEWLEVKSGLKPGDEVVIAGQDALAHGTRVRVVRDVDPFSGAKVAESKGGDKGTKKPTAEASAN